MCVLVGTDAVYELCTQSNNPIQIPTQRFLWTVFSKVRVAGYCGACSALCTCLNPFETPTHRTTFHMRLPTGGRIAMYISTLPHFLVWLSTMLLLGILHFTPPLGTRVCRLCSRARHPEQNTKPGPDVVLPDVVLHHHVRCCMCGAGAANKLHSGFIFTFATSKRSGGLLTITSCTLFYKFDHSRGSCSRNFAPHRMPPATIMPSTKSIVGGAWLCVLIPALAFFSVRAHACDTYSSHAT